MTSTAAPSATDQVVARIDAVAGALADLADVPMRALDDARLHARVAAAGRLLASAQELYARAVGEADRAGAAERAGAPSTRGWLVGAHGVSPRDAARAVAQAAAMTPAAEPTRLAWARGEVGGDQAEAVADAVNALPEGADPARVEGAQLRLLAAAKTLSLRGLRREAARLAESVLGPAEADRRREERLAAQELEAYQAATFRGRKGLDGVASFSGTMPNLTFDMLMANLDAIASPRRGRLRDDHPAAAADPDAQIPYANRLGRALCDLVEKIDAKGVAVDGANATLVVTVDERALRDGVGAATLSSGDDLSVSEARRLACAADVLPAVLDGDSRVLDLGRASRLFDKSQRIALAVRDGGCVFPSCDRPPGWAEAHHLQPWSEGGRTDLANGALLCGFHHRLIHKDGGWQLRMSADGVPEVIPPARVDPRRRPIRHERHRRRRRSRPEA